MTSPAELVAEFKQPNRRIRIFLSYAHEDADIAKAIYDLLNELSLRASSNITVIFDKVSLEPGSPLPILEDIQNKLVSTDFFILIYSGVLKASHSYTGEEVGFFRGLIRNEGAETTRKIYQIYFGKPPVTSANELGINLAISPAMLSIERERFRDLVSNDIHNSFDYNELIQFFQAIGRAADAKLPPTTGEKSYETAGEWETHIQQRNDEIKNKIVPNLMLYLYDSFGKRIKKKAVEQSLIEFSVPKNYAQIDLASSGVPPETTLIEHGNAFNIFQLNIQADEIKWEDFKRLMKEQLGTDFAPIISSIERSAISTFSPRIDRDDEQIIKAPRTGDLYRIIVTKQFEYYDGSRVLHMYFIPVIHLAFLENSDVAITLGLINVAVEYRELLLNSESEMSLQAFYKRYKFDELKEKVGTVIRRITVIQDRSRLLQLNTPRAMATYYGKTDDELKKINAYSDEWWTELEKLMSSAKVFIANSGDAKSSSADTKTGIEEESRSSWIAALTEFTRKSNEINSDILVNAINNLKKYLGLT